MKKSIFIMAMVAISTVFIMTSCGSGDLPTMEKNGLVVSYSEGSEERAQLQMNRVLAMKDYYEKPLDASVFLALILLNEEDWGDIGLPFGVPAIDTSGEVSIIIAPATQDGVLVQDALSQTDLVPQTVFDQLDEVGYTFEQAAKDFPDLVAFHEVGHAFAQALELENLNLWLSELTATYFLQGYLVENEPELAQVWLAMGAVSYLQGGAPEYTSLAKFDELYSGVGVPNYDWYQKQFAKKAADLYERHGLGFARALQEMFGGVDSLDGVDALNRLEEQFPGEFISWAQEMAAYSQDDSLKIEDQ